ncbi:hypothetical protein [Saccharothrix xinjiangensis]|uniref:Uncharacterized protein n=1 Tax=Saccharothrix xinjiangensis TaxID=204798 RepID=A0ABV9XS70_9PSEU
MTWTGRPARNRGAEINFNEARAEGDKAAARQQIQAARTVAQHSLDVGDCRELLSMLGLSGRRSGTATQHDVPTCAVQDQHADRLYRDAPDSRATEGARR